MTVITPGQWIGVLGGGQLGQMMLLAARAMGFRSVVWDPDPLCPAGPVAEELIVAEFQDRAAVAKFAGKISVATYEFENVDVGIAQELARRFPVFPPSRLLWVSQNRLREKQACRQLGLDTTRFFPIRSQADFYAGLAQVGYPAVLKTAEGGYDGKGQYVLFGPADRDQAWQELGQAGELILEQWVTFEREVSVVVARAQNGALVPFPVAENIHRQGILDISLVPARIAPPVAAQAQTMAGKLAEHLGLVGVMAVEFFVTSEGRVLVNEIAPRPHNSGHYTIEACETSQFEQHIRAITGLPLGSARLLSPAVMVNLLGEMLGPEADYAAALAIPGTHLHLYGKTDPRPGRKMGHLTVLADTLDDAFARAQAARQALTGGA